MKRRCLWFRVRRRCKSCVCVCVCVICPPTPLAPITPTRNPNNVTLSVTGCHVSRCQARCTWVHAPTHTRSGLLPSGGFQWGVRVRESGKPNVRLNLCLWWSDVLSVFLLAGCISGPAPVPRPGCPAVRPGPWSSGKPRGAVGRLRPHTTSRSAPRGFERGSHSGSDVVSRRRQDVWQMWQPRCSGWWMSRWVSTGFQFEMRMSPLSLGSRSMRVSQYSNLKRPFDRRGLSNSSRNQRVNSSKCQSNFEVFWLKPKSLRGSLH